VSDNDSPQGYPPPGLDRISTDTLLRAFSLVRRGRVYDLSVPIGGSYPRGSDEFFAPFTLRPLHTPAETARVAAWPDFANEVISGTPHVGTHIDAFSHVQSEGRIFGGALSAVAHSDNGWSVHGAETTPPILGRGALIDVAGAATVDVLPDDVEIGPAELEGAMARQGTEVGPGDIVLVRTGKIAAYKRGEDAYFGPHAGVSVDGALWLYERGMAALGTDTSGTEPMPFRDPARSTHRALLVERGVHLLETLDLDELASERVYEFLFIALAIRFVGATGSWVRPVAVI
jgi:kynurenine formamidase